MEGKDLLQPHDRDVVHLVRQVLGGGLARALEEAPPEIVPAFERLATSAVEHHLDRRLRATRQLYGPRESDPRPRDWLAVGALDLDRARPGLFQDQTVRRPAIGLRGHSPARSVGEKVNAIGVNAFEPWNDQAELALRVTRRPNLDRSAFAVIGGRRVEDNLGIGEPATVATCAAVGNAIFNAIGRRVPTAPFTPDRVLAALAQK